MLTEVKNFMDAFHSILCKAEERNPEVENVTEEVTQNYSQRDKEIQNMKINLEIQIREWEVQYTDTLIFRSTEETDCSRGNT